VAKAALPAGSVIQVVSTTKTDTFTSSVTGTWTDITALTVSITPRSASNKILVLFNVTAINLVGNVFVRLMRDATPICIGDAASARSRVSSGNFYSNLNSAGLLAQGNLYLDSPSSTIAITYKVQIWINEASTAYINRTSSDTDATNVSRSTSTITVQEIAG
jgi:hypothetical protein